MADNPQQGDYTLQKTVAAQQALEEGHAEQSRRMPGGSAAETLTPSTGVLTLNASSLVRIGGSSGVSVNTLNLGNFPARDGHMVAVTHSLGGVVTLEHGTGNLSLRGAVNFDLPSGHVVFLVYQGTTWCETGRCESDPASLQAFLTLGDAAYATQGTGGNLDATTLQGFLPTDFQVSGSQAADSALLAGEPTTSFVQTDGSSTPESAAVQTIKNALVISAGGLSLNDTSTEVGIAFQSTGTRTGRHVVSGADFYQTLYDTDGITVLAELRFTKNGALEVDRQDGNGFVALTPGASFDSGYPSPVVYDVTGFPVDANFYDVVAGSVVTNWTGRTKLEVYSSPFEDVLSGGGDAARRRSHGIFYGTTQTAGGDTCLYGYQSSGVGSTIDPVGPGAGTSQASEGANNAGAFERGVQTFKPADQVIYFDAVAGHTVSFLVEIRRLLSSFTGLRFTEGLWFRVEKV